MVGRSFWESVRTTRNQASMFAPLKLFLFIFILLAYAVKVNIYFLFLKVYSKVCKSTVTLIITLVFVFKSYFK